MFLININKSSVNLPIVFCVFCDFRVSKPKIRVDPLDSCSYK